LERAIFTSPLFFSLHNLRTVHPLVADSPGVGVESPSLVLVINDTKLLMSCVKCFELGISNTCDEGVRDKEW
jgi:hypothetical protein